MSLWIVTAIVVVGIVGFAGRNLLRTPGCEQSVWRELLDRPASRSHSPLSCLIGLHALDAWEADRVGRQGG